MSNDQLAALGRELVASATDRNLVLRVIGGVGVYMVCPSIATHQTLQRPIKDLDLAAPREQIQAITELLAAKGIALVRTERSVLHFDKGGTEIEVTEPDFREDYRIDLSLRLGLSSPTVPMADLLLIKLQRKRFEEKDIKDTIALLLDHAVAQGRAGEQIDTEYIAKLTARDWGLFTTVYDNTVALEKVLDRYLDRDEQQRVWQRIELIQEEMDRQPKSMGWMLNQIVRRPTQIAA